MDIQRAKEEIKRSVQAYLATDDIGRPLIPPIRQRPILLMGPPGVGKTQIMEQIAQECDIALVAYTITHHTRQSAVGLPRIVTRCYNGKEVSITEYTLSEIIASFIFICYDALLPALPQAGSPRAEQAPFFLFYAKIQRPSRNPAYFPDRSRPHL